jgi:phosphatidylserine decarboxylase
MSNMSVIRNTLKRVYTPIHKEGYVIILVAFVIALLFAMASDFLGYLAFILFGFCVYFFRDPDRILPNNSEDLVIAPADGVVDFIGKVTPPKELDLDKKQKWTRVSIFLNVFNVHVQRVPVSGTIEKLHYVEGKFVNVSSDKDSKDNERQTCLIKTIDGLRIGLVQIAGMIARRIVCDLKKGDKVKAGDRCGIIRFGSRVDLYLPNNVEPEIKIGQTMIGGETVIAKMKENQKSKNKNKK